MMKKPLLSALFAATALGVGGAAIATPALADVTYTFQGNFQNGNYAPQNATFSITLPDFVTSDTTFSSTQSNLSCGDNFVQCTGVSFLTDASPGQDVVTINFNTATAAETENYDFAPTAFTSDGGSPQDAGVFGNNGTLTTSGQPDAVSAAPEPSTWLLMVAGVAGIGLMFRRARRAIGFRVQNAFAA